MNQKFNITNGYKVKVANSFELHELLKRVRTSCQAIKDVEVPKMAAQVAAFSVDMASVGRNKEPGNDQLIHNLFAYLALEEQKARSGSAGPGTDWNFSMVLIPIEPAESDDFAEFMAMVFSQQQDFLSLWEDLSEVTEYHYIHGQPDPPEGVTSEEWAQRLTDWERVVDSPAPKLCGLEYIACDTGLREMFRESKDDAIVQILEAWPTFEERITVLANSVALEHKTQEILSAPALVVPGTKAPDKRIRSGKAVKEAVEWLETKPPEVGDLRLRYTPRLDKEITEKHLNSTTAIIV